MPPLHVRLTKLSDDRHRFAFERADGSGDVRELETRSFLLHDLTHFAVESEARLGGGFYGGLASGAGLDTLADGLEGEALAIERIVGPLSSAFKSGQSPDGFAQALDGMFEQLGTPRPAWADAAFVTRAFVRLERLAGRWRATPFGGTMELAFPPT